MHVKTSKESFGQSAKILSGLIDQRFGKQGRGSLSQAREMLAKTLKFDSAHAIENFLASVEPKAPELAGLAASLSAPLPARSFGQLPLDERLHALGTIALLVDPESRGLMSRAASLLAMIVEVEASEFSQFSQWMGPGDFMARIRQGLSIGRMRSALRGMPSPAEHKVSRLIQEHLSSLPGGLRAASDASPDRASDADEQHGYLQAGALRILAAAERMELRGSQPLVPALAMEFISCYALQNGGVGHWLAEPRFFRIAARISADATRAGRPHQNLDVWSFMLTALASPIQSERREAIACLMDIVALPASHAQQAYENVSALVEHEVGDARAAEAKKREKEPRRHKQQAAERSTRSGLSLAPATEAKLKGRLLATSRRRRLSFYRRYNWPPLQHGDMHGYGPSHGPRQEGSPAPLGWRGH